MGSFSVLNNLPSVNGINQLNFNNINLNRTLNRLASGKRINTGADDAAGLQIADQLRGNVAALNQAVRNANDGISVLQIADSALEQITNLLHRAVTLAEEAATDTIAPQGKAALQYEFDFIKHEIGRIAQATNFNGQKLFNGQDIKDGKFNVFVGDLSNAKDTFSKIESAFGAIGTSIGAQSSLKGSQATLIGSSLNAVAGSQLKIGFNTAALGLVRLDAAVATDTNALTSLSAVNSTLQSKIDSAVSAATAAATTATSIAAITTAETMKVVAKAVNASLAAAATGSAVGAAGTQFALTAASLSAVGAANARIALGVISTALNDVATMRGNIGASINRLQAAVNVLSVTSQNTLSAEDTIRSANMADEITNMTKYQIMAQTGIAALAQANANSQNVLGLLR